MKKNKNEILTAYCGLYCEDCLRYKCKSSYLANELLKELDRIKFKHYANIKKTHVKEFAYYDEIIKGIKAIKELKCNTPCRLGGNGCSKACSIKLCVKKKKLKGCWECKKHSNCDKFKFLYPFHKNSSMKNLKKIRKYGLKNWAKYRHRFYPWS